MKSRSIVYFLTALCFSILFYQQGVGLNYFLFGMTMIGISLYFDKSLIHSQHWSIASFGVLLSTFFAMYYGNDLTISVSIISVLILQTLSKWRSSSFFVALFAGALSVFGSPFFMIRGRMDAHAVNVKKPKSKKRNYNKGIAFILVMAVLIVFLQLYSSISPVFAEFVERSFDIIGWGWFFFTLFALIILYTFFFPPRLLRKMMHAEQNLANIILQKEVDNKNVFWGASINFQSERFSAMLLFGLLNILLLILIATDVNYLFIESALPYGLSYAEYIHSGVGAVIASIVLAILLIVFYYRGKLNFDKQSKGIKGLTYIWIALNIALVILTMVKNQLYIDAYALTYKRIGVFYYLALAIIGLLSTSYKLYAKKSTWYLFKSNVFIFYIVLVASCTVNWNVFLTKYNMQHNSQSDYIYLTHLGFANYPILWEEGAFDSMYRIQVFLEFKGERNLYSLPVKVAHFLAVYEGDGIQSYNVTKQKVYDYFMKLDEEGNL